MFERLFRKKELTLEQKRTVEITKRLQAAVRNAVGIKDLEKVSKIIGKEMILNATAKFYNLGDFREALTLIEQSKEYVDDLVEHENAHANVAEREGVPFEGYWIVFLKNDEGGIYPQPMAKFDDSLNDPDENMKEILKKILRAPEEYGNKLSKADIEMLENLDK